MSQVILLIGTLDTKGEEFAFVRNLIHARGHQTVVLDAGVLGEPLFAPDISAQEVAQAGGQSLESLRMQADRGAAIEVMAKGVQALTAKLYGQQTVAGVLGLGGSGGTVLGTAGMRELPVGVPKVMVSTMASGDVRSYVDVKDIAMMYSVVDVAGINRVSRHVLSNAAGMVCGMAEQQVPDGDEKPLIAATMFGVTTPCVEVVREQLSAAGYEVVVFHATGSGGRAMEELIKDGHVAGVADITTTELCDELVGGVLSAGPQRLNAAAQAGIPQVVSCGALDMVNFGPRRSVPARFSGRTFYEHNASVTLMRTTPKECARLGRMIAKKLNKARRHVKLLVPLQGFSMIDKKGEPFYDPEADKAVVDELRRHTKEPVELIELDCHINDQMFGEALAHELRLCLNLQRK